MTAAGLDVPEQLSVVGIHDVELADFLVPALTTVRLSMGERGARAVEQIAAVRDGGATRSASSTTLLPCSWPGRAHAT